jgi:hypothetical protein
MLGEIRTSEDRIGKRETFVEDVKGQARKRKHYTWEDTNITQRFDN